MRLVDTLSAQPFSTLSLGSEFRPSALLAPLLSRHPLWHLFEERVTRGADFPLRPIPEDERLEDVVATLDRGNHKSARTLEFTLLNMLKDEVSKGWQLPLPKEVATEIPFCEVAPLGLVPQLMLREDGSRKEKLRLTHDQSFNACKGMLRSLNDKVDAEGLTPARFGRTLMRFLHNTCELRRRFPKERLLMTKVDWKSAYRRIHLQHGTAAKLCTCTARMLLVALRITFGGRSNVSQWSDVSEVVTDFANDLVRRDDWNPADLKSPHQSLLASDRAVDFDRGFVHADEPLGVAYLMAVSFPQDKSTVCPDTNVTWTTFGVGREEYEARLEAAVPLAFHIVGRPVDKAADESFPGDNLLAMPKFLAEAKAS